ncbi:hypothetical protein BSLG_005760 [Batrachochytrium salamandrivorans]|nr:hypothetical protein BSLG_005760 [Batrachochytrium salamandrivorans]
MASDELLRLKSVFKLGDDQEDQAAASESQRQRKLKSFGDTLTLKPLTSKDSCSRGAKDLIQYFLEFNKGIFTRLDTLRQSEPDGGYKAAIARRLNTIAKEVDIADTEAHEQH